jgi:hypothetical protein
MDIIILTHQTFGHPFFPLVLQYMRNFDRFSAVPKEAGNPARIPCLNMS